MIDHTQESRFNGTDPAKRKKDLVFVVTVLYVVDVLLESRAICRYVSEKYANQGNKGLYGTNPLEKASLYSMECPKLVALLS